VSTPAEHSCPAVGKDVRYIDVRDVARAHIRAAEVPEAKGRYLLTASPSSTPGSEVVDIIRVSRAWGLQ